MNWRKASRSNSHGGSCVEAATAGRRIVAVRDSKNPDGPTLAVSRGAWRRFTRSLR